MSEAILSERSGAEASTRGPRGGYRRKKLRRTEQQVVDLLRSRSFASVYELSKELNSFAVFKTVRGLVRLGLVAKNGTRPVLTEKALQLGGSPFHVPANATQRSARVEAVAPPPAIEILDVEPPPIVRLTPVPRHVGPRVRIGETAEQAATRMPALAAPLKAAREVEAPFDIRTVARKPQAEPEALARPYTDRSRRVREVRARTISVKRMTKRDLHIGKLLYPPEAYWRPKTRGECAAIQRPCPFVSCRFHLFLDVSPDTGAIKLNFPDLEPDELGNSCVLDISDRGGETLEFVAQATNITRERIRQIEARALIQLRSSSELDEDDEGERTPVRAHHRRTA